MVKNMDPNPLIRSAPHDAFDVLPGNVQMHFAERVVAPVRGGEWQLKRVLERIEADYDFVLVDCPPADNIVTDNALLACQHVLIPAGMHPDSQRSIATLMGQIDSLDK